MALNVSQRSPPDGKSSPPSLADTSVIIPGFLSKSSPLSLAVPSPAPVPLTKVIRSPKPAPRTSKTLRSKTSKDHSVPRPVRKSSPNRAPTGFRLTEPPWVHGRGPSVPQTETSRDFTVPMTTRTNGGEPPPRASRTLHGVLSSGSGSVQKTVSAPVSGVIQTTRSGAVHGASKMVKAHRISDTRGVARPPTDTGGPKLTTTTPLPSPERKEEVQPLSPISPTRVTQPASVDVAPYFIHPLNLCDPFVDNIGLVEICSLHVDELQYLSQTNQNKPVYIKDGRTVPSFLVRIWARGSGKYLDILSVGELYGRGLFGHSEQLRLIVVGPRTVMIQSTKDSRLHVGIKDGVVTGKGKGDADCHFIIHQGPTGYCLLESLLTPGSFLGVRKNGNIIRPSQVKPDSTAARFVIQKESLGAL